MRFSLTLVPIACCVLASSRALAQAPVIPDGECTYLVGAPPGTVAAMTESSSSETVAYPMCIGMEALDVNRDRPHSIALWAQGTGGRFTDCTARARVFTEFVPDAVGSARVVTTGAYRAFIGSAASVSNSTEIRLRLVLSRMDPTGETVLASTELLAHSGKGVALELDEPFAAELRGTLQPGAVHRLSLEIRIVVYGGSAVAIDFGSPGSGRGLWYDSIEVCLEDPNAGVNARLASLEDRDLELRLYQRECLPTVWMPAAQGGRLEAARSLAGDLLARATATAAPGVNTRVAAMRIASADTDIATGDFQRACRDLSEAVRALTSP